MSKVTFEIDRVFKTSMQWDENGVYGNYHSDMVLDLTFRADTLENVIEKLKTFFDVEDYIVSSYDPTKLSFTRIEDSNGDITESNRGWIADYEVQICKVTREPVVLEINE